MSILGKHIVQVKPEKGWPFVCKCLQCYHPFALHEHLERHISNHHKRGFSNGLNVCPWQGCNQKISNESVSAQKKTNKYTFINIYCYLFAAYSSPG